MIDIGTTIEHDLGNAGLGAALGNQLADRRSGLGGSAVLDLGLDVLVERRSGSQGTTRAVVDDLGVDVLVRTENRQTRTTEGTSLERLADTSLAAVRTFCTDSHRWRSLLLLAFFAEDLFAQVPHTLALVGLRLAPRANVRRNLANLLL